MYQRAMIIAVVIGITFATAACGGSAEPQLSVATSPSGADDAGPTDPGGQAGDAGDLDELLETAATYYEAGQYEQAAAELQAAVDLDPDNLDAATNLALAYFHSGAYEDAAAAWSEVIAATTDPGEALFERGKCYFNLKRYDDAIADLTRAIESGALTAEAYRIRGKAYAFQEEYKLAIADFTRTIELDPAADEAYLNRAISTGKVGDADDLPNIIADCGMVMQISNDEGMLEQARSMLENIVQNSGDPAIRQLATDALEGKAVPSDDSEDEPEASLADIDIHRAPGHSIGFEDSLEAGGSDRFLFLASPGDTVGASVTSETPMLVGIQNAGTGAVLSAAPSGGESLFVTIPENALYYVVVEDAGGLGGAYAAAFEASPKVSFALDPNFLIIGRLPEGGLLYYTYSGPAGSTLRGNVIPHADTPIDAVVTVRELESQEPVYAANETGAGENEAFSFTIPEGGSAQTMTYIVSVEDADRRAGAYVLAVASDAPDMTDEPAPSPESVVQLVFDAANSLDFSGLADLCDPLGESDDDVRRICGLAHDDADAQPFTDAFAAGRIAGPTQISPEGDRATVPFLFGPDGNVKETMELIRRDGRWYLLGF